MGQLVGRVLAEAEARRRHAVALVPGPALRQPLLEGGARGVARPDEVLHLHLLELAHPEDEVAGADLVPERLPDLGDPERDLLARALLDVLEVDVRALGGLGPEVDDRRVVLDRSHPGLEHQVEAARRRERPAVVGAGEAEPLDDGRVEQVGRAQALGAGQLVEAIAAMAGRALDEWVAEAADVTGGDPDLGVHEDPRVEPDDVLALLDHRPPPRALDVVLQLDAERPVVPDGVDPAVDLGAREHEAAALRERHDRLEIGDRGRDVVGSGNGRGVGHGGLQWAAGRGRDGRGGGIGEGGRTGRRQPADPSRAPRTGRPTGPSGQRSSSPARPAGLDPSRVRWRSAAGAAGVSGAGGQLRWGWRGTRRRR